MTTGLKQNSKISKKLLMTICLAAFITSMTVYGKIYFDMGLDVPARADFRAFLTAADMVKGGDAEHLYDLSYQMKWQAMRFGNKFPINETSLLVYVYPPWVATLLMPLGGMPILTAYLIILLVNIVVLTGCAILIKLLLQEHTDIPWIFACLFIAFPPVVWTLVNGQFSLWLLLGFLGCWYGIVKDSQVFAGLALGLLLIKPYLLILPCLYIFFIRRWRVIIGLSISGLISFLLCLPLGGWSIIKAWINLAKTISQAADLYGIHPESMHTVRGVLHSLKEMLMITDINLWWVITAGIITIMIIYLLWCISQKKNRPDPAWGLIALGSLLAAPHANSHDLTLLVPCYMVLPFIRFTKYKNIIIWIVIISFTCIWGSVLYQSSETPCNLITVTAMFAMFFLFTIRTKIPGEKTNSFFS